MNFISYLMHCNFAHSTILTYISALSFISKLWEQEDTCNTFVVKKMLKASDRATDNSDPRLPISAEILLKLFTTLTDTFSETYTRILMWSMYLTAFNGFLRIGEISPETLQKSQQVLQFKDVSILQDIHGEESLEIQICYCKGNISKKPFHLSIQKNTVLQLCAVSAIKHFMTFRGNLSGPFFIRQDKKPLLRHQFNSMLKLHLLKSQFNVAKYKGHSFRIGAATNAHKLGYDDPTIMKMGRWKSSAMLRYIRMPKYNFVSKK